MKDGQWCPLIRKECVGHRCAWHINIQGTDPQTGMPTNQFGCAIAYVPLLQVEIAAQNRGTTASVDNLRNEQDRAARAQVQMMAAIAESQNIEPVHILEADQ
ncbi:MAG: hypothetical protein CMO47_00605 [Verrucomicrobiales bacterium]|nr:hypothetical protein [Verrucomicrobiales bacterium]